MDTTSNMLTSIINAQRVNKERVVIPYSTFSEDLANFMQKKGVVSKVRTDSEEKKKLIITLSYHKDRTPYIQKVRRVSKPGSREYITSKELPYTGNRPGMYILSTSRGLMDQVQAQKEKIGGELLCLIWLSK